MVKSVKYKKFSLSNTDLEILKNWKKKKSVFDYSFFYLTIKNYFNFYFNSFSLKELKFRILVFYHFLNIFKDILSN